MTPLQEKPQWNINLVRDHPSLMTNSAQLLWWSQKRGSPYSDHFGAMLDDLLFATSVSRLEQRRDSVDDPGEEAAIQRLGHGISGIDSFLHTVGSHNHFPLGHHSRACQTLKQVFDVQAQQLCHCNRATKNQASCQRLNSGPSIRGNGWDMSKQANKQRSKWVSEWVNGPSFFFSIATTLKVQSARWMWLSSPVPPCCRRVWCV